MGRERQSITHARVDKLIRRFDAYLLLFDKDPPFRRGGQLEHHVSTIKLRRTLSNAGAATTDLEFLKSLYRTLQAWGIGQRGSRLVLFDAFVRSSNSIASALSGLKNNTLEDAHLDVDSVARQVWGIVQSLDIVHNDARLVAATKALHHVLPDLVVPIDRKFTGTFFNWHRPQFQYGQEKCFMEAYQQFASIAAATRPSQFVGTQWRTSATKIIDNAVVAYCRAENLPEPS